MDFSHFTSLLLAAAAGYLLGSIPFGLILTRLAGLGDIRSIGSGNIGATNVLRTGHRALALATLIADAGKGALAVAFGWWLSGAGSDHVAATSPLTLLPAHAGGFGAFLGHVFSVWLGFKGGKGVAAYIGATAALCWPAALVFCAVWLTTAKFWRYSSLAALIAAVAAPIAAIGFGQITTGLMLSALSLLLFYKHDENIRRLLAGDEPRIGASR